jgi:hypothetical protein
MENTPYNNILTPSALIRCITHADEALEVEHVAFTFRPIFHVSPNRRNNSDSRVEET